MGLNRSQREYMHKVHQEIYGKSNPWVGKPVKIVGAVNSPVKKNAISKKTIKVEKTKPLSVKNKTSLINNIKSKNLTKAIKDTKATKTSKDTKLMTAKVDVKVKKIIKNKK